MLFALNPEKQELARESVNKAMEGSNLLAPSVDQISKMKYLWACVQECLRLYPPVPSDSKVCVKEDVLPGGGIVFPGQRVSFEPYAMGRLMFKDDEPNGFKPERWLNLEKLPTQYEFPGKHSLFKGIEL